MDNETNKRIEAELARTQSAVKPKGLTSKVANFLFSTNPITAPVAGAYKATKGIFNAVADEKTKSDLGEISDAGKKISAGIGDIAKAKGADIVDSFQYADKVTGQDVLQSAKDVARGTGKFAAAAAQDTVSGLIRVADFLGESGNKLVGNEDYLRMSDFINENKTGTSDFLTGGHIGSYTGTQEAVENTVQSLGVSEGNRFAPLVGGLVAGAELATDVPIIGTLAKAPKAVLKQVVKKAGKELIEETSEVGVKKILKEQLKDLKLSDDALDLLAKDVAETTSSKDLIKVMDGRLAEIESRVALNHIKEVNASRKGVDDIIKEGKVLDDVAESSTDTVKTFDEIVDESGFKGKFEGDTPLKQIDKLAGETDTLIKKQSNIKKALKEGKVDESVAQRQLDTIEKELKTNELLTERLTAQNDLISQRLTESNSESLKNFSFDAPKSALQKNLTPEKKRLQLMSYRKGAGGALDKKWFGKRVHEGLMESFDKARKHLELVRGEEIVNDSTDYVSSYYLQAAKINAGNILAEQLQDTLAQSMRRKYGKAAVKVQSEISEYMYARHALDFNNVHAGVTDAAGISTKSAREIVERIGKKYKDDSVFRNVVETMTEYNKGQLKQAYKTGLITKESYDTISSTYKNYVPLFREGINEAEQFSKLVNFGKGNTTVDVATGGKGFVDDVVDNSFFKGQSVNRAVVDNETKKEFGKFILTSEQKYVDEAFSVTPQSKGYKMNANTEIDFYSEGKRYVITMPESYIKPWKEFGFKDNKLWKFGAMLTGKPTRLMSKMLTSWNPSFKPVSFVRDGMESIQVADSVMGLGMADLTGLNPKEIVRSLSGITNYQKGIMTKQAKYYDEALNLYGISTGRFAKSLEKHELSEFSKLVSSKKMPTINDIGKRLSNADEVFENSIRQMHYIRARNKGFTGKQAAIVAQEAGINFSKKGAFTEFFGPAFMFMNATVQGNTNFIRSLKDPKVLGKFVSTTGAASLGQEAWNNAQLGPDWRDEIDDYILKSHMVFVLGRNDAGEVEYIKVPIPHGAMPFWNVINGGIEVSKDKNTAENVFKEAAATTFSTLSPFGGGVVTDSNLKTDGGQLELAKSIGNEVTPSVFKPITQAAFNQNFFGSEIVYEKKDYKGEGTGEYSSSDDYGDKGPSEAIAKGISNGLKDITGSEGKFVNERMIKHFLSSYIGLGLGKDVINTTGEAIDVANGEKPDLDKLIVTNKFFGRSKKDADKFRFERQAVKLMDVHEGDKATQTDLMLELSIRKDYMSDELNKKYGLDLNKQTALMNATPTGAAYFKKLTTATSDKDWEDERISRIIKMKEDYIKESHKSYKNIDSFQAKQYKGLLEHMAGEQQLYKENDATIKKWFEDQGMSVKVNSTLKNKIEDRYYNIKRVETPGAEELYQNFNKLEQGLNNGEIELTKEDEDSFFQEQYQLYKNDLLSKYQFDKNIKDIKKASAEVNVGNLIELVEAGSDPREVLAQARQLYNKETEDLFIDYLRKRGN